MSAWAIKVGELKGLSREALLLFAARSILRAAPWRPPGSEARWDAALRLLVDAAFGEALAETEAQQSIRALGDLGATAAHQRDGTPDEAMGRAMNYAAQALCAGLEAATRAEGPDLKKGVLLTVKQACSIGPLLAHAGRVDAPPGLDPVTFAGEASWAAVRADLAALRPCASQLGDAADRLAGLLALAPLWPGGAPAWTHGP